MARGDSKQNRAAARTRAATTPTEARGLLFGERRQRETPATLKALLPLSARERANRCDSPEEQAALLKECRFAASQDKERTPELLALLGDALGPRLQPLLDDPNNLDLNQLGQQLNDAQQQIANELAAWGPDHAPAVRQHLLDKLEQDWPEVGSLFKRVPDYHDLEQLGQGLLPGSEVKLGVSVEEACRRLLSDDTPFDPERLTRQLRTAAVNGRLIHLSNRANTAITPLGISRQETNQILDAVDQEIPDFPSDRDAIFFDEELFEQSRPYVKLDHLLTRLQVQNGFDGPIFWTSNTVDPSVREGYEKDISRALNSPLPWKNLKADLATTPPSLDEQLRPLEVPDASVDAVRYLGNLLARASGRSEREALELTGRGIDGIAALRRAQRGERYDLLYRIGNKIS